MVFPRSFSIRTQDLPTAPLPAAGQASSADASSPSRGSRAGTPPDARPGLLALRAACHDIPVGQLHQRLTASWLEGQLALHEDESARTTLTAGTRAALQRHCEQLSLSLRLHAHFRGAGQADAAAAGLMCRLGPLFKQGVDSPLLRILVDRIYSEFQHPPLDWSRVSIKPGMNEATLALALQGSRERHVHPPVRFKMEAAPGPAR